MPADRLVIQNTSHPLQTEVRIAFEEVIDNLTSELVVLDGFLKQIEPSSGTETLYLANRIKKSVREIGTIYLWHRNAIKAGFTDVEIPNFKLAPVTGLSYYFLFTDYPTKFLSNGELNSFEDSFSDVELVDLTMPLDTYNSFVEYLQEIEKLEAHISAEKLKLGLDR